MPARILILVFAAFLYVPAALAVEASTNEKAHPYAVGATMSDLLLHGEQNQDNLDALGLQGSEPYHLSKIKAEVIVIVAFSMYCPHCQREAPNLNELNALIKSRGLDKKIKLIGVGIGNSDYEVKVFRTKYSITFPLFSDWDFSTATAMGDVGTPFFYVLKQTAGTDTFTVARTLLGRMESPSAFLDQIIKTTGR